MSGGRGSSALTSTAMRLPLTATLPLATARVGEDGDVVLLGGVQFDDGAAAEPEHLMDRHQRGAEHHRDIDGDLVERGHAVPFAGRHAAAKKRSRSGEGKVTMVW